MGRMIKIWKSTVFTTSDRFMIAELGVWEYCEILCFDNMALELLKYTIIKEICEFLVVIRT